MAVKQYKTDSDRKELLESVRYRIDNSKISDEIKNKIVLDDVASEEDKEVEINDNKISFYMLYAGKYDITVDVKQLNVKRSIKRGYRLEGEGAEITLFGDSVNEVYKKEQVRRLRNTDSWIKEVESALSKIEFIVKKLDDKDKANQFGYKNKGHAEEALQEARSVVEKYKENHNYTVELNSEMDDEKMYKKGLISFTVKYDGDKKMEAVVENFPIRKTPDGLKVGNKNRIGGGAVFSLLGKPLIDKGYAHKLDMDNSGAKETWRVLLIDSIKKMNEVADELGLEESGVEHTTEWMDNYMTKLMEKTKVDFEVGNSEIYELDNNQNYKCDITVRGGGVELAVIHFKDITLKTVKGTAKIDSGKKNHIAVVEGNKIDDYLKLSEDGIVENINTQINSGKTLPETTKEALKIIQLVYNGLGSKTGHESKGRVRYIGLKKGDEFGMKRLQNVAKTIGKYPNVNSRLVQKDTEESKYNMGPHIKVDVKIGKAGFNWSINGNGIRNDDDDNLDHERGKNAEESLSKVLERVPPDVLNQMQDDGLGDLSQIMLEFIRITNMTLNKSTIKLENFRDKSDVERLKRVVALLKQNKVPFKTGKDPEGLGIGRHVRVPVTVGKNKMEISFNHMVVRLAQEGETTRKGVIYIHGNDASELELEQLPSFFSKNFAESKDLEKIKVAIDSYVKAIDLRRKVNLNKED